MPDTNVNELKTENDIRNAVFSKMLIQELVAGLKKDGEYQCILDSAYDVITIGTEADQFTLNTDFLDPDNSDNNHTETFRDKNLKIIANKAFEYINFAQRKPMEQVEVMRNAFAGQYDKKKAQFDRDVQALAFKTLLAKEVETSLKAGEPFYCNANGTSRNVTISENAHGGYTLALDSPALRHAGGQNGKTVELDSLQHAVDQACDFIGYADNPPFAQDVILHSVFEQDYSAAKQQIGLLTGQGVEAPQPHSGLPLIEQVESWDGVVYVKGKLANQQDVVLTIELNGYQGAHVSIHALNEKGLAHPDKLAIDVPQLQDMLEQALPRTGLCNPQGLSAAVSKMATVHEPLYAFRYDVAPAPTLRADALAAVKYIAEQRIETTYQINDRLINWKDLGDEVQLEVDGKLYIYSLEDAPAELVSHAEGYAGRAGLQSLVNSGLALQGQLNTQEFEIAQFKDLLTNKIAHLKADDPTSYLSYDDPDRETRIYKTGGQFILLSVSSMWLENPEDGKKVLKECGADPRAATDALFDMYTKFNSKHEKLGDLRDMVNQTLLSYQTRMAERKASDALFAIQLADKLAGLKGNQNVSYMVTDRQEVHTITKEDGQYTVTLYAGAATEGNRETKTVHATPMQAALHINALHAARHENGALAAGAVNQWNHHQELSALLSAHGEGIQQVLDQSCKETLGYEQEIDFETHKPSSDEQSFKNARAAVKGLETDLDLEFINDQFGAWINIQENNWTDTPLGSVNTGEVSHGVAFIGGQLYEMSPSAYFYRDESPWWSPVVQADNEEIAKVYQAITGKEFPVFKADGSEPEPFNRLIELKEEAGFVFDGSGFVKWTGVAESNAADPQQGAGEDAHIQVPAPAAQTKASSGMRF